MSDLRETDQNVLDNLDEWARLICEKHFEKETQHIPPAVVIKAALLLIAKLVPQTEILTKESLPKILAAYLEDEMPDVQGIFAPQPVAAGN